MHFLVKYSRSEFIGGLRALSFPQCTPWRFHTYQKWSQLGDLFNDICKTFLTAMVFELWSAQSAISHFWPKAELAQSTVCFGYYSHSIQLIVMKFTQMSHFNAFYLLVKRKYAMWKELLHKHTFIIFNIIKIYYFKIIIKPYYMIQCHTLNYFVTRINIYQTILDKIYPNIYHTFSIINWYVTSGAEKSMHPWYTPLVRIWA